MDRNKKTDPRLHGLFKEMSPSDDFTDRVMDRIEAVPGGAHSNASTIPRAFYWCVAMGLSLMVLLFALSYDSDYVGPVNAFFSNLEGMKVERNLIPASPLYAVGASIIALLLLFERMVQRMWNADGNQ